MAIHTLPPRSDDPPLANRAPARADTDGLRAFRGVVRGAGVGALAWLALLACLKFLL